jgi:hypothetical protein
LPGDVKPAGHADRGALGKFGGTARCQEEGACSKDGKLKAISITVGIADK